MVLVLTMKSNNRLQNIVEKRTNCSSGAVSALFNNIFNISLISGVKLHNYLLNVVLDIFCLNSANLICPGRDISKYFRVSLNFEITRVSCIILDRFSCLCDITKTCLYNFDPLNPTFI